MNYGQKKEKISDKVLNESFDELLKKEKKSEKDKLDNFDDEDLKYMSMKIKKRNLKIMKKKMIRRRMMMKKDIEAIRRANKGKIKIEQIKKKKLKDVMNKQNKT